VLITFRSACTLLTTTITRHRFTLSASKITVISPMNTTSFFASEEVNRLVRTVTDELGTRGLPLSSFVASPLISARLVFAALSKPFISCVRCGIRMARRGPFCSTLSLHQCVFVGVLSVFYVSLGATPFTCHGSGESIGVRGQQAVRGGPSPCRCLPRYAFTIQVAPRNSV
jgi:hypothetical protein